MKQMRFPCQQFGKTGETFGKKLGQVASLLSETKLKQGSLIYPVRSAKILKVKFNLSQDWVIFELIFFCFDRIGE